MRTKETGPEPLKAMRWGLGIIAAAFIGVLGYLVKGIIDAGERGSAQSLQTQHVQDQSPQKLASAGEMTARESSGSNAGRSEGDSGISLAQGVSESTPSETTQSADLSSPYAKEMAIYLSTFLGDDPDVLGWNGYLSILAANVKLDPSSVSENADGIHGNFVVPETDIAIGFIINDDGYKIEAHSNATLEALGNKEFSASLAFKPTDGVIPEAYGVVQFHPHDDQQYYEDGPVGYVFGTNDRDSSFRPIRGEMRDGHYWVLVPPPSADQKLSDGDLGSAYHWMTILQQVERSSSLRKAEH